MHNKWWDYSGYLLNLNGKICLEGLIVFALAGCAVVYFFAPLLDNSLIADLKTYTLDYIESVKNADLQSCINCIDTELLKDVYDNRDKVCSSAQQINRAFQATDDFKKIIRYAGNPLFYMSKLHCSFL